MQPQVGESLSQIKGMYEHFILQIEENNQAEVDALAQEASQLQIQCSAKQSENAKLHDKIKKMASKVNAQSKQIEHLVQHVEIQRNQQQIHLDDQFSDIDVDLNRQLKSKPQNSHIIIQNGNFI